MGSSAEAEHKRAEFAPLVDHVSSWGAAGVIDNVLYNMFGDTALARGRPDGHSRSGKQSADSVSASVTLLMVSSTESA
ncbi:hypothetical protein [Nocardia wallacei]|uniref:hypothetical protein n=1 Tax=Nocardia wallacei TaxID=480035 RepID=UPI002453915A|nr:hypothetical protein [Nocardia wallacei]